MVDKLVNSEINAKRIANVEYCFGVSGVPLQVPGRVLVGEGILTKICRKKPKSRQFFLFNDILVYGTILINKKKYAAQHIIPLVGLVIEDLPDEVVMKNGWLIKTSSKSFAVYAGSPSEKAEWIRHIKKCANDLLEQTGQSAIKDHAAVWIPDSIARICMHCNQTQFTMLNRRHHCRACGSVVCGDCSRNRTVILHQSNRPVRVCDSCYNKSYNYLNTKTKKISLNNQQQRQHQETSPASTTRSTDLQLLNDAIKTCVDDTMNNKDSRIEEWVNSASEQITQNLKSTLEQKKETNETVQLNDNDKVNEIVNETENINLEENEQPIKKESENDLIEKEHIKIEEVEEKILDENQKLNGTDDEEIKKEDDSLNDQIHETSDSEDEHHDLSSSVEDILSETLGKPTFYEDVQLSKDHIETELKLDEKESEIKIDQKQLEDEKIKNESNKIENLSKLDEKTENILNENLVNKLKDNENSKLEDEKTAF